MSQKFHIHSEEMIRGTPCLMNEIRTSIQKAFDEVSEKLKVDNICIQSVLKTDGNPKSDSDFSIYISPCVYPLLCSNLDEVCDALKTCLKDLFQDCRPINDHGIQFFLNRSEVYRRVFKDLFCQQILPTNCNETILLYDHDRNTESLTNHRSLLIAEHIMTLLLAYGCSVYCHSDLLSKFCVSENDDRIRFFNCDNCDFDSVFSEWLEKCKNSEYKLEEDSELNAQESLTLDCAEYLKSRGSDQRQYDYNITQICIQKTDFTECFRESASLHHVLNSHVKNVDKIIHIFPVQKRISALKCGVLAEMFSEYKVEQLYLTCQTAISKTCPDLTVKDCRNNVRKGIEHSLQSKYGPDVMSDEVWLKRLDLLTDTVIKFDFLMTSPSTPLNLGLYDSDGSFQDKGGAFVQYNCARLAVIFKKYSEKVKCGDYEKLPEIDEIDFNLLKQQEEWNLFSKYVLPYPSIVKDLRNDLNCGNSVEISIATHRISRMLVNLSRDFSLYYNKSRVLVEPVQRLLPRMYARLYLLKAVYYVIENALSLLNLSSVDRM